MGWRRHFQDFVRAQRRRRSRPLPWRSTPLLAVLLASLAATGVHANQFVRLDFSLVLTNRFRGTAFIELFDDKPLTRDNFMQYVNGNLFDGSLMHRLSKNFVLQGGGFYPEFLDEGPPLDVSLDPDAEVDLDGNPATLNPTVVNEHNVGTIRSNARGTIAMARKGGLPNSADSQWFVNWGNNSGLDTVDGGFCVFAQVVGDGMSTLFDAYNTLGITNLNPDFNNDGVRDPGYPFGMSSTDGVPFSGSSLLVLNNADRIDYYGAGSSTTVPAGLNITTRNVYIDTGAVVGTGTLTIGAGRELGMREGINLTRTVTNHGKLAPGLSLGQITIQSFTQASDGTLAIDLQGTTVDTQFDKLIVTNTAQLAGKLEVSLLGGFAPAAGNSFNILSAASIAGNFTTLTLPQLNMSAGLVWSVNQTATAFTLNVVKADYSHNGVVDGADFLVWQRQFGTTMANLDADGNGDGTVNLADRQLWAQHMGETAGTPSSFTTIPEPTGASLAALAAAALGMARRRFARRIAPI